ncbi:FAD synthetase family protein [Spirochaeta thermophila]|uniref:FAD synthase n=1 Tax=Winmispira thermophila (strain ATCC 49972 / DSM 6192 / RI 19.B1) TaxID=665571 RepID=E0RSS3_WINT6|nr:FAD synthetase family protein [Spirochaeta thermophila]ADN02060.1 riboflavin biosynthesis protein RibF [Spirochaeta thermophila DSM 6192]
MCASVDRLTWAEFLSLPRNPEDSAVTIGVFDGVHLGHQELLETLLSSSLHPLVITFDKNPEELFSPDKRYERLTSLRQKVSRIREMGIPDVLVIDFSRDFSTIEGREFLERVIDVTRMKRLLVGKDFRCGRGGAVGIAEAEELCARRGVELVVMEDVTQNGTRVSSTEIRKRILEGELDAAEQMLGRPHTLDLRGLVGEGRGTLCIPRWKIPQILPPPGEYAGRGTGGEPLRISIHPSEIWISPLDERDSSSLEVMILHKQGE